MPYTLVQLNAMDRAAFTAALGAIFEDTPAIVARAWERRPFASVSDLHDATIAVVNVMNLSEKTALIVAHPSLGDRVKMAETSVREQSGLGLDRLSPEEYDLFQARNRAYRDRFGFPFIVAVRNHTKASILEAFARRLHNSVPIEFDCAIAEIAAIARFRLNDLISE